MKTAMMHGNGGIDTIRSLLATQLSDVSKMAKPLSERNDKAIHDAVDYSLATMATTYLSNKQQGVQSDITHRIIDKIKQAGLYGDYAQFAQDLRNAHPHHWNSDHVILDAIIKRIDGAFRKGHADAELDAYDLWEKISTCYADATADYLASDDEYRANLEIHNKSGTIDHSKAIKDLVYDSYSEMKQYFMDSDLIHTHTTADGRKYAFTHSGYVPPLNSDGTLKSLLDEDQIDALMWYRYEQNWNYDHGKPINPNAWGYEAGNWPTTFYNVDGGKNLLREKADGFTRVHGHTRAAKTGCSGESMHLNVEGEITSINLEAQISCFDVEEEILTQFKDTGIEQVYPDPVQLAKEGVRRAKFAAFDDSDVKIFVPKHRQQAVNQGSTQEDK